jgi:outer membrane immunogenic protein
MRIRNLAQYILLLTGLLTGSAVMGQQAGVVSHAAHPEVAVEYNFINSNAPAGGSGCFSLNGGSASLAWPLGSSKLSSKFALVGDIGVSHASSIASQGYDLTLSTYTLGGRYSRQLGHSPIRLFGEVLAGVGHASGSLVEGNNTGASNAGAAFAGIAGGGVDLHVSRHLLFRLAEADYLATTFDNGSNDHQNNLRIGAGVVFAF